MKEKENLTDFGLTELELEILKENEKLKSVFKKALIEVGVDPQKVEENIDKVISSAEVYIVDEDGNEIPIMINH
ncbi:hypothetical protein V4D30_01600 [Thermodesulfovibrio sp. 3907-1M]|uniref:Uncharacterized protein n=1 Tax=Thermodesulfovibrio autotrophicus TaxID=3118333 RepID=A0AAU8GWU3_9BACT